MGTRRAGLRGLGLLLVMVASVSGTAVAAPLRTRGGALPTSSTVVDSRFVTAVQLDDGALRVEPAPRSDRATITQAQAATEIWASPSLGGRRVESLGLGLVTIAVPSRTVPRVTDLLAWVGFAKAGPIFCPEARPKGPAVDASSLPSSGWAAVVVGADSGSPAVAYTARSAPCGSVSPASLTKAIEVVSVPWVEVGVNGQVVSVEATFPPCGEHSGNASGGSATSITISVQAMVSDVHRDCGGPKVVPESVRVGPIPSPGAPPPLFTSRTVIVHAVVGPISQTA